MRLPHGEVEHRLLCEFESDEILGASVMLVGLDAAKETDALRHVHESVAVGEFTEVERAADGGADGGPASREDGKRALASAEELALRE
jgi:hypothetical protein